MIENNTCFIGIVSVMQQIAFFIVDDRAQVIEWGIEAGGHEEGFTGPVIQDGCTGEEVIISAMLKGGAVQRKRDVFNGSRSAGAAGE